MHILISNDDGLDAPGIEMLEREISRVARVTVVAPDRDHSGASNSLTLSQPIRILHHADHRYRVAGTPTDCVHLALTGLLDPEPDMVVSGINAGANLGDDVIYSGTVAAAMEGRYCGLPAVAVSLAYEERPHHFETAGLAAVQIVQRLVSDPLPADTILNVNVPDIPWDQVAGFEVTRLGHRHRAEPFVKQHDPRGRPVYWIGAAGPALDAGPGTDFHAISRGCVSVTPIHVDLTRYTALETVGSWVSGLDQALTRPAESAGAEPAAVTDSPHR